MSIYSNVRYDILTVVLVFENFPDAVPSLFFSFTSFFLTTAMMPAWIFTLGRIILKKGDLYIPYEKIGIMIIILLVPITIGILIRCFLPRVAGWLVRLIKPFSAILLVYIFTFGIYANLYIIRLLTWEVSILFFVPTILACLHANSLLYSAKKSKFSPKQLTEIDKLKVATHSRRIPRN